MLTRIPRGFYDDHAERDLPAPPVIRSTARHYWVDKSHADMAELVNDARHYADDGTDCRDMMMAARAMLAALGDLDR